jgi:Bacterial regulatory protein, arsR family.
MSPGTEAVEQTIRTRRAFLAALRRGPQRKRELVAALETSRSTVDRAIGDLADAGLVTETAAGVKITLAGRMAVEIDRRTSGASASSPGRSSRWARSTASCASTTASSRMRASRRRARTCPT